MRALRLFAELGLTKENSDPKTLTLKGRLLKDQAKRSLGAERRDLLVKAGSAYQAAFALDASSYALINAAALAYLSGQYESAREFAAQALAMIEGDPNEGETAYWREATRSEALLLLGRREEAEAALARAIAELPHAYEDRAATLGQFELIEAEHGASFDWLERYRPPEALYFSGLINLDEDAAGLMKQIDDAIAARQPGFVFGALAAGADIILAERLVQAGAILHVVLPCDQSAFREASVEPYGANWNVRFDRLIDNAETVRTLEPTLNERPRSFGDAIDLARLAAMGASIRQASILRSTASVLSIRARGEDVRDNFLPWQEAGHSMTILETDRVSTTRIDVSVEPPSGDLCAALAVSGPDTHTRQAANALDLRTIDQTYGALFVGAPRSCLALLKQRNDLLSEGGAGFLLDANPISESSEAVLERSRQLNHAADTGMCVTDYTSASVASLLAPKIATEDIGEMRTLRGPVSLWSIVT